MVIHKEHKEFYKVDLARDIAAADWRKAMK